MKISVLGLGYVGSVCCGCFSDEGHMVIGTDINSYKVSCINSGRSPVLEPGLEALIEGGVARNQLRATLDLEEAIRLSDVSMICVGTPSHEDGSMDMSSISRVTRSLAEVLLALKKKHIVVYRSTLAPGEFERTIYPLLYGGAKLSRDDVCVVYNPEFIREGSAISDFYHPAKTILGVNRERQDVALQILKLYEGVEGEKVITDIPSAQMIKYADNIFHALKITFANEIGLACKRLGLDSHGVMNIFCQDKKLNISEAYLKPGLPFGGSCLPKDLKAFCYSARTLETPAALINSIEISNARQISELVEWIKSFEKPRIGLIGLTFKPESDDLRNSPALEIASRLYKEKYELCVYDPNLKAGTVFGENLEWLNSKLPGLTNMLCPDLEEVSKSAELFVIFNNYPVMHQWLPQVDGEKIILDLVRVGNGCEKRENYHGLYW